MRYIDYKSPEIGKNAMELMERDKVMMFGAHTRTREIPLVVDYAKGATIKDVDGKEFLDFGAGYAVVSAGHCPQEVIDAITEQSKKLIHISGSDFYYLPQIELAEKLVQITPGKFSKKIYFGNSGAESIDASLKICRHFTRRSKIISYFGAFHGRTFAGMSVSGSKAIQKAYFSPLLPEVTHTPYAYCYRCTLNLEYPTCKKEPYLETDIPMLPCVEWLTDVVFKQLVDPEEVAGLIVEPIQGEGGYLVPPPEFHKLLRAITKRYGIIYIADEIQSGLGRTGKWFALDHWNVEPDIILIAKALASGLPLSAVVGKAELMDSEVNSKAWRAGSHGSTFGGNPVSCAAGVETLKLLENGLIENAAKIGNYIKEKLVEIQQRHRIIGDVRGVGLMIGIEIVADKKTKKRLPEDLTKDGKNIKQVVMGSCFKRGLIVLGCGVNSIRFSPPLTITKEEADRASNIFEDVIEEIERAVQG